MEEKKHSKKTSKKISIKSKSVAVNRLKFDSLLREMIMTNKPIKTKK